MVSAEKHYLTPIGATLSMHFGEELRVLHFPRVESITTEASQNFDGGHHIRINLDNVLPDSDLNTSYAIVPTENAVHDQANLIWLGLIQNNGVGSKPVSKKRKKKLRKLADELAETFQKMGLKISPVKNGD